MSKKSTPKGLVPGTRKALVHCVWHVNDDGDDGTEEVPKVFDVSDNHFFYTFVVVSGVTKFRIPENLDVTWGTLNLPTRSALLAFTCVWWLIYKSGRMLKMSKHDKTFGEILNFERAQFLKAEKVFDFWSDEIDDDEEEEEEDKEDFATWIRTTVEKNEDALECIIGHFRTLPDKDQELINSIVERGCEALEIE
jgi:hypothetical protein